MVMHKSHDALFHFKDEGTMIFPPRVVVIDANTNLFSGSTTTSLLSVSPLLAPDGHESVSRGVLVFPGT